MHCAVRACWSADSPAFRLVASGTDQNQGSERRCSFIENGSAKHANNETAPTAKDTKFPVEGRNTMLADARTIPG
ncbi:hypothetical protein DIPPA_07190 [Diplonema papillatum]|nr:hypothetical protein DIPPA_07190 [Diplonema papillatum]